MIGILAPMQVELQPVAKRLGLDRGWAFGRMVWTGRIEGRPVVATLAGVGPASAEAATRYVIETFSPSLVVVSGIAGGLDPGLRIGDLVVPEVVIDHATRAEFRSTPVGDAAPKGRMVTTDGLLGMEPLGAERDGGAVAVDMENASVAAVCKEFGVPWLAFRGISDLVHEGYVDDDTMTLVKADGRTDLVGVARLLLRRPGAVGTLVRLARDTNRATAVAAAAAVTACRSWDP